jgi:hypothetical protein
MWKRIGIIIGGAVFIWVILLVGLTIESIFSKFSGFLIIFFNCYLVGWLAGIIIGEKGWLYGGLSVLTPLVVIRLLPGHNIPIPSTFMPSTFVFSILVVLSILSSIAGGLYGEMKRRKARI